ncbi:N-acetylmannosamine-6-phosphate 2-epimerase [Escherichia coli]|nr:N-acetylmannosamine-6-phosphate 2-epimerase [Escherichia coli]
MKTVLDSLKGKLIVSCQALENEPLHSPFIMSRMALAAAQGGAAGIRANSVADISSIKEIVSLPMIGIIKRDYPGSEVFITATLREVDELMTVEPEIIALDATARPAPWWSDAGRTGHADPRSLPVRTSDGRYSNSRRGGDS